MKKTVSGWILLFLGALLLTAGVITLAVGPGKVQKVPLDVDSDTYLTGQAQKLNPGTGQVEDVPVKVYSNTKVDPKKSDDKVVVWVNYTCVNIDRDNPPNCLADDDDRLISNSVDTFASDRHTGMAVNDPKYVGQDAAKHEGLVNKFPFNTEKKTYPYWDDLLGTTVNAKYDSTVEVQGLKTYLFKVSVPKTNAKIAGDVEGTYQTEKSIWVEPRTGAIVNQEQHETRLLPDGSVVLDMALKFTDATVKQSVADGKDNLGLLNLVGRTVPIVGIGGGLICLAAAAFLLLSGRRPEAPMDVERREPAHV
jgi:hypothetical protein